MGMPSDIGVVDTLIGLPHVFPPGQNPHELIGYMFKEFPHVERTEVRDHLLAEDADGFQHLVLGERAHLDEAHDVVDARRAQSLDVGDGRVGVTERVVGVVER